MKRTILLSLLGAAICLPAAATAASPFETASSDAEPGRPLRVADPFDVRRLPDAKGLSPVVAVKERKAPRLRRLSAPASIDKNYVAAFQTFYEGDVFKSDGGDFLCYEVNVAIEGTTAVISNLFNLEEGYPGENSTQEEIVGVYDPTARTITVPTPREFDKGTVAGTIYGYYQGNILSGTVDKDGVLTTRQELVFTVSEDGNSISTDQNFGVMIYNSAGSPQGFKCIYKGGAMVDLSEASELVCLTSALDLGRCYAGEAVTGYFNVFNLSDDRADLTVTSSDPDLFQVVSPVGVTSSDQATLSIEYAPVAIGTHTGTVSIADGNRSYTIAVKGECVAPLDFTPILTKGDVRFTTSADYPFSLTEADGAPAARSGCVATDGCVSFLQLDFTVPEGETGTLSWKGTSSSEVAYSAIPTIEADGVSIGNYAGLLKADISSDRTFGPGNHRMTFTYSCAYPSYFTENDFMTVSDVVLETAPMQEREARLVFDSVKMPNSLIKEGEVSKSAVATLLNVGTEGLTIGGGQNSDHFAIAAPNSVTPFLSYVDVPIIFKASEPGEYEEDVVISTSAGDFTVHCSALVREYPDFQAIVGHGEFTFSTDEQYPWLVKDGKAYNSTSKVKDEELTYCRLRADFEVPPGKLGKLSWKGLLSTAGMVDGIWTDYLMIGISTSGQMRYTIIPGEYDLDTSYFPYFENPNASALLCQPGKGYITFNYVQYGDGAYYADDLCEIYDLSLDLLDHEGNSAILEQSKVRFRDVYQGKYAETTVQLLNTGTEPLQVLEVDGSDVFYGRWSDLAVPYDQRVDVVLTFSPDEAGEQEGTVTIHTTAGDFEVECSGFAISTDGMLLAEDFENDGEGWTVYDRDGDNDAWNLAFNVYGGFPQGHVHSGEECIVSFSWDYITGTFHPDNWTFSPVFEVPDTGAWLTWWSAGDDNNRPGDVYSVYAGTGTPQIGQEFDMDSYRCLYTETIVSDEWKQHCVDLSEFAGKVIHVAFRHYDCSGCYMVKIDDVIVYDHNPSGLRDIAGSSDAEVVSRAWYSVDGRRLASRPDSGVVLLVETLADGTLRPRKLTLR